MNHHPPPRQRCQAASGPPLQWPPSRGASGGGRRCARRRRGPPLLLRWCWHMRGVQVRARAARPSHIRSAARHLAARARCPDAHAAATRRARRERMSGR
eukprot:scaffold8094_cov376-Prasinococcus_capsulatus_cf.AAC.5